MQISSLLPERLLRAEDCACTIIRTAELYPNDTNHYIMNCRLGFVGLKNAPMSSCGVSLPFEVSGSLQYRISLLNDTVRRCDVLDAFEFQRLPYCLRHASTTIPTSHFSPCLR